MIFRMMLLGLLSAAAAALPPMLASACGNFGEGFELILDTVVVAGEPTTDLGAYAGFDVYIYSLNEGLSWTASKEGERSYHENYHR